MRAYPKIPIKPSKILAFLLPLRKKNTGIKKRKPHQTAPKRPVKKVMEISKG